MKRLLTLSLVSATALLAGCWSQDLPVTVQGVPPPTVELIAIGDPVIPAKAVPITIEIVPIGASGLTIEGTRATDTVDLSGGEPQSIAFSVVEPGEYEVRVIAAEMEVDFPVTARVGMGVSITVRVEDDALELVETATYDR